MSNKTRVVIMGCGGSGGVPYAGNVWGKCDPTNPKNSRLRPSVFIERGKTRIVIDTGPDFRQQINRLNIDDLDAVLYSHAHFDHVIGIDDLRPFFIRREKQPIPVYGTPQTFKRMKEAFGYIFNVEDPKYPATVIANDMTEVLNIQGVEIQTFDQVHGSMHTKGFRIGDFAYSTDLNELPPEALETLKGVKTWVVGSYPTEEGQYNHASLPQVMKWVDILKPEMTYLTHLTAGADYQTLCDILPPHIRPAYDGLELFI